MCVFCWQTYAKFVVWFVLAVFYGALTSFISALASWDTLVTVFPTLKKLATDNRSIESYSVYLAPAILSILLALSQSVFMWMAMLETRRHKEEEVRLESAVRTFYFIFIQVFLFYSVSAFLFDSMLIIFEDPTCLMGLLSISLLDKVYVAPCWHVGARSSSDTLCLVWCG